MKLRFLSFSLFAIAQSSIASDRDQIPPEILAGRTCEEHIVQAASMTAEDLPGGARGREHNAIVVVSYKLDGSGKAVDPKVAFAKPAKVFEQTTINLLNRTQFTTGAVEDSCYYIRTYSAVRRGRR